MSLRAPLLGVLVLAVVAAVLVAVNATAESSGRRAVTAGSIPTVVPPARYRRDKVRMLAAGEDVLRLLFKTRGSFRTKLPELAGRAARLEDGIDRLARYRVAGEAAEYQRAGLVRDGRPIAAALRRHLAAARRSAPGAADAVRRVSRRRLARFLNRAGFAPQPPPVRPDPGIPIRAGERHGRILFSRATASGTVIASVEADGTGLRTIVRPAPGGAARIAREPAPSPDGRLLAYVGDGEPDGVPQLYLADPVTGATLRRLTDAPWGVSGPAWSPDGRHIAVAEADDAAGLRLRIVTPDGAGGRVLPARGIDAGAAWSPDGATLAVTRLRERPPSARIVLVRPDGSGERVLTGGPGVDTDAAWSPDGRWIVFTTSRDRNGRSCYSECAPNREVYVVATDGSGLRRLTRSRADDRQPTFSPDGRSITWSSDRRRPGRAFDLWHMNADGTCPRRLTSSPAATPEQRRAGAFDQDPAWLPAQTPTGGPIRC